MNHVFLHRVRRVVLVAGCSLAALVVAGCSSQPADPPQDKSSPVFWAQAVSIDNFAFNPPAISVPVGATVTWVNRDDVPHTVTADDKQFASQALDTDDRFSHTFTTAGTYDYFCAVHPHMTGRVTVK